MENQKPAYLVASSFMPEGQGDLALYGRAAHPLLQQWRRELVVTGETGQFMDHFEGAWKKDARFTHFRVPSMGALQGFWHSEEYQTIKHLRTNVIPHNFTFAVEGFDAEEWAAQNPDHAYVNNA